MNERMNERMNIQAVMSLLVAIGPALDAEMIQELPEARRSLYVPGLRGRHASKPTPEPAPTHGMREEARRRRQAARLAAKRGVK